MIYTSNFNIFYILYVALDGDENVETTDEELDPKVSTTMAIKMLLFYLYLLFAITILFGFSQTFVLV